MKKEKTLTVMENKLAFTTLLTNISRELYELNKIVAYPLSDTAILGWAECIIELAPDLTPERLKTIINKMKLGQINYDTKKGIQNIFLAFKPVIATNTVTRVEINRPKEYKND